ncbi:TonB-dependent receptor [Massilia dura]|uniref:TonB-dependent receptor n=2 Tax=Pseudoduganella dura TaxID=321982 RepID=A0A6I3XLK2_9BURK|nr:TonB-dependent receptor [Pseudoduganella dura]
MQFVLMVKTGRSRSPRILQKILRAGRIFPVLAGLALAAPAFAAQPGLVDLAELSLEDLSKIRVTSVSKRDEPLSDATASIYVITAESIRRSGAASLPEALRLAPNIQVARIDARNYAITARGFSTALENKLLVLIDGRSVYSPLFSGVFWDAQDVAIDDIDRIEVISGPGATLWGANAVNGVINITTKAAGATPGTLASISADGTSRVGTVRHGGELDNGGSYRIYARTMLQEDLDSDAGARSATGMKRTQAGFRADWAGLTVQGDAYSGELHQAGTRDIRIAGANLLGRKTVLLASGTEVTAQAYWDFTQRDQPNAFNEHLNTIDVQVQGAMSLGSRNRLVAGAGVRMAFDRIANASSFAFLPGDLDLYWANVFMQNETRVNDQLRVIAGVKLEQNNYTGLEILPTLRLAWKTAENSMLWTSASRTVRAPSRIDRDFYAPSQPPVVAGVPQFVIGGGPQFASEVANVAELGYRIQPSATVSFSATAFATRYDRLRTLEPSPNGVGQVFSNLATGRTHGLELWGQWQVMPDWRLSGGAVVQRVRTELEKGSRDLSAAAGIATSDPSHYWSLRSSWDIAAGHGIDLMLRRYGALPSPAVPAYSTLDLNYTWQATPNLHLSLFGSSLLDSRHVEFGRSGLRTAYERQVGVKLTWRR